MSAAPVHPLRVTIRTCHEILPTVGPYQWASPTEPKSPYRAIVIYEFLPGIVLFCADVGQQFSSLDGEPSQYIFLIWHRFSDRNLYFLCLWLRFLFLDHVNFIGVLGRTIVLRAGFFTSTPSFLPREVVHIGQRRAKLVRLGNRVQRQPSLKIIECITNDSEEAHTVPNDSQHVRPCAGNFLTAHPDFAQTWLFPFPLLHL